MISVYVFQSTHPRGVRPDAFVMGQNAYKFQSTHPRGVRLNMKIVYVPPVFVSIHAPTRGATSGRLAAAVAAHVSIHAPTRGATVFFFAIFSCFLCFNPRTHEGCDGKIERLGEWSVVSIHAPTRGATPIVTCSPLKLVFQSTHPRGVRHNSCD